LRRGALLLAGAVIGSALTLTVLAIVIPARLFGVSEDALEYSIFRHEGDRLCDRLGPARWRCEVLDPGPSTTETFTAVVSPGGCWEGTSGAREIRGCIGFRDYVRLMDR
jgi:hypothetical protein